MLYCLIVIVVYIDFYILVVDFLLLCVYVCYLIVKRERKTGDF